jgi:hypothetical protein
MARGRARTWSNLSEPIFWEACWEKGTLLYNFCSFMSAFKTAMKRLSTAGWAWISLGRGVRCIAGRRFVTSGAAPGGKDMHGSEDRGDLGSGEGGEKKSRQEIIEERLSKARREAEEVGHWCEALARARPSPFLPVGILPGPTKKTALATRPNQSRKGVRDRGGVHGTSNLFLIPIDDMAGLGYTGIHRLHDAHSHSFHSFFLPWPVSSSLLVYLNSSTTRGRPATPTETTGPSSPGPFTAAHSLRASSPSTPQKARHSYLVPSLRRAVEPFSRSWATSTCKINQYLAASPRSL